MAAWGAIVGGVMNLLGTANTTSMSNEQMEWSAGMQKRISDSLLGSARKKLDRFKTTYLPLQTRMLGMAREGVEADLDTAGGRANADASQATDRATRDMTGQAFAGGINPNSGKFLSLTEGAGDMRARTGAGAISAGLTEEANRAKDMTHARQVQMLSIGKGLPIAADVMNTQAAGAVGDVSQTMGNLTNMYGNMYGNLASIPGQLDS